MEPVSGAGICARLNVVIFTFFLCIVAIASLVSYQRQRSAVRREILSYARFLAAETAEGMAAASFPSAGQAPSPFHEGDQLQRLANRLAGNGYYSITIVSTMGDGSAPLPGSDEARELAILQKAKLPEYQQIVAGDGGSVLLYLRPLVMAKGCLGCHGSPADAPEQMRRLYPPTSPVFRHQEGDFAGAVAVRVPMSAVYSRVLAGLRGDVLSRIIVFAILMSLLNLYLRKNVVAPIVAMCVRCETGAEKPLRESRYPRELRRLSRSINTMVEALKKAEPETGASKIIGAVAREGRVAVVAFREDGTIVAADGAARVIFAAGGEIIGKNLYEMLEEAGPALRGILPLCLVEGTPAGEAPFIRHRVTDPAGAVTEVQIGVAVTPGENTRVYTAFLWEVSDEAQQEQPEPQRQDFFFREKPE